MLGALFLLVLAARRELIPERLKTSLEIRAHLAQVGPSFLGGLIGLFSEAFLLGLELLPGLLGLITGLVDLGWQLIASGGTARLLQSHGLPATQVADYTGSPEILGGRVKTLHPAIHGGLLARPTDADHGCQAGPDPQN